MIEPINPTRREWLKKLRNKKKLKTREIAEMLGVSFQHYNDIERGTRNPSIELSYKMAELFNVDVSMFLMDRTKFRKTFQEIKEELLDTAEKLEETENDEA